MKPILIDELIKKNIVQEGASVKIDNVVYNGYQIAKPLNYDPNYLSLEDRQEMANAILEGKAIAVRYFCDLTEDEKIEYVKSNLKK